MSYDILIFDPAHAPKERKAFIEWWDKQEWAEWDRYNDPAVTTPSLRAWFMEMIEDFPPLNGPYASPTHHRAASYSLGYFLIYVAIWFNPQGTHERAFDLAAKYRLGFCAASSPDGEIWLPGSQGELVLASKTEQRTEPHERTPITDPRIPALLAAHPPGGAIVWDFAQAENPRRTVIVVYSLKSVVDSPPLVPWPEKTIARFSSELEKAGICYAVVEQEEHSEFASQLHAGLSVASKA